jgi:hypothetical protein
MWDVPRRATRMTVSEIAGSVKPVASAPGSGAEGYDSGLPTNVSSYGGISGISYRFNTMFLVGVFLTDDEPREGEHPERLGYTDEGGDYAEQAPLIAQTFFVGDGEGRVFTVPSGATRLYLGFADAVDFQGDPGFYGNNSGELAVAVAFDR